MQFIHSRIERYLNERCAQAWPLSFDYEEKGRERKCVRERERSQRSTIVASTNVTVYLSKRQG